MADYERLVKELNAKLLEKDEYVEELKAQISTLTQREETLKQEIGLYLRFVAFIYKVHESFCLLLCRFLNFLMLSNY